MNPKIKELNFKIGKDNTINFDKVKFAFIRLSDVSKSIILAFIYTITMSEWLYNYKYDTSEADLEWIKHLRRRAKKSYR